MGLNTDRILQLAAADDDTIPPITADQADAFVAIVGTPGPTTRRAAVA